METNKGATVYNQAWLKHLLKLTNLHIKAGWYIHHTKQYQSIRCTRTSEWVQSEMESRFLHTLASSTMWLSTFNVLDFSVMFSCGYKKYLHTFIWVDIHIFLLQISFLVSAYSSRQLSEESCSALGLLAHYLHLSQFSWMLIQVSGDLGRNVKLTWIWTITFWTWTNGCYRAVLICYTVLHTVRFPITITPVQCLMAVHPYLYQWYDMEKILK